MRTGIYIAAVLLLGSCNRIATPSVDLAKNDTLILLDTAKSEVDTGLVLIEYPDTTVVELIVPEEVIDVPVDIRASVKTVYDSQLYVRELSGKNDGVEVERYLAYTGLGKGYAWCAAFVCWSFGEVGVDNPKSAWSPTLMNKNKLIYQRNDSKLNGTPRQADVFGIYFDNLKRVAHVGFVDEWQSGSYAITVEGNTNQAGSREGDGVYRKRRLKTQIYQVADYIR